MEDAELYANSNAFQKRDTSMVLSEFMPLMNWSNDDEILDVGAGSGDVTRNLLWPGCVKFDRIVGIDRSQKMVNYAREHFENERLSFEQMDIADAVQPINVFPRGFTKIFSFFCLHWIQKQRKAISNLYQLLRPGGTCLLVFLARNPVFDMYERLAKNPRWAPYMNDLDKFIPIHQYSTDAATDFRATLENCGFRVLSCEAPEFSYVFENLNYLRDCLKAVNPFVNRMPQEEQNDYMIDCLKELQNMKTPLVDGKMVSKYNLL
uniref:Methyltransferase domain-containing protein n=1 Tax=Strigamia maritima TaxID=126957 RepID=T1IRK8_STRMM